MLDDKNTLPESNYDIAGLRTFFDTLNTQSQSQYGYSSGFSYNQARQNIILASKESCISIPVEDFDRFVFEKRPVDIDDYDTLRIYNQKNQLILCVLQRDWKELLAGYYNQEADKENTAFLKASSDISWKNLCKTCGEEEKGALKGILLGIKERFKSILGN